MTPLPILHHPAIVISRRAALLFALVSILGLGGCAQIPSLGQLATSKDSSHYSTADSFAAPATTWPDDRWWTVYADPQLDALIDETLRDSPDMAAAVARLRRAEAAGQVSGAALLPHISANASASEQKQSYNHLTPRAMLPDGWQDYGRATLDFNWELDFWGKNRAALAAATSATEASRADLAQARLMLATSVASNYAELVRLFAIRDTAARAVEVRGKTAALFAERLANGMETRGSVRQADASCAAAEGDLLAVDEQIGLQRNRLAALLGAGPDLGLAIRRPQVDLRHDFGLPEQLAVNLLGRRPDVVAARLQAEAQAHRIDQKKAEFYPNINLAAFVGVQSLGLDMLTRNGSSIGSVGPAISLPIFTGWRLQGELRGQAAAYQEAVANYNRTVTQALQDVADVAVSGKALGPRLAKSEEAVDAAGEAHRVARNRYEGGLSSFLEVLTAEDALLTSLRSLSELRSRAFSLDVALMRALGGGYRETTAASDTNS